MAGRSEKVRDWSETLQDRLMGVITIQCDRLVETDDAVEIAKISKKVDAVGKIARAARSVRVINGPTRAPASKAPQDPRVAAFDPKDEAPMNDRNEWTPEREAALRAEVDRRLEKLYRSRERKGFGGGDAGGDTGEMPAEPPAHGASPGSPD